MAESVDAAASAPVSLVILGAGGDLTNRLLLPGLGSLLATSDRDIELIGCGRSGLDADEWRSRVETALQDAPADRRERVLARTRFESADATDPDELAAVLASCAATPVLYFALPPAVSAKVCGALETIDRPDGLRLALEKPFGTDEAGARGLNTLLHRIVPEERIFRVDHFLGTSTVLGILGVRFANRVFGPIWNRDSIERVEVVYDESLALEGRAGYYDRSGALIDMIQSHLLEVLGILAMGPIDRIDESALRDGIHEVLEHTRPWGGDPVAASRRARYTAGEIDGRTLPSYVDEDGVDPDRRTETLARLELEIDTDRWRGVPFVLRSGKALGDPRTVARVTLRPAAAVDGLQGEPRSDWIELGLHVPAVRVRLTVNGGDDPFEIDQATLSARQADGELLPYGEVLDAVLAGDPMLSVRGDTAEACWRIVDPVLAAWRADEVPLEEYAAGSAGPDGWASVS
ncbi:glucose-6-phosphate 1-dehydrogenase [Agromyces terreus]|uniref:Glucose-6-phosphate 1-dehydrogenase n=1 Tax=Agromyces terreus TaxID=424795 RepID=A0A9X2GZG0_9MICO|nr:glucose-6-phosphate dehydrogenase [Agromyces terreus]MCP2370183.1 glucose-6-phosphate 1-dehydrogenase [Agromyces terreus]